MEKYQPQPDHTELLVELHYLPCLDYVSGLLQFRRVRVEAHEHYQKQSYRNRCYVLTANKVDTLTVPVQQGTHHNPVRDLRIDTSQPWQMHHWRCLKSAYGKAPFFDYYAPEFEPVYQKNWAFLFDLNYELLTICLKLVGQRVDLNLTDCYEKVPEVGLFDARSLINPRNRPESYVFYKPKPYAQNFGFDFVPNLSIIDLLFCQGPLATEFLSLK
ncbi:WbqC family protein [Spirosoma sp. RP8]|uniref:WbqC family protein n=1 Tax=Spirosoma liriopis TaxID=2937440 RepID=A0ABT0HQP5_9BACT|nr:WbqC family protein [Spirosoma liriopis]MCK8494489.1 WbqC family protein [Spirosoma liriopis]